MWFEKRSNLDRQTALKQDNLQMQKDNKMLGFQIGLSFLGSRSDLDRLGLDTGTSSYIYGPG